MDPAQNPVKSGTTQTAPDQPVNDAVVASIPVPTPTAPPANPPTIPPKPFETTPLASGLPAEPRINPPYVNPVNPAPVIPEPIQQPPPEPVPVPLPPNPITISPFEDPPSFSTSPQSPVYIPAQNPPPPTSYITPKRFPFMFITIILILVILGFGGTVLYFKMVPSKQNKVVVQITPPVTIFITPSKTPSVSVAVSPTAGNPFATPSGTIINPFISVTPTYANPFNSSSQNPFDSASGSSEASKGAYQNPFESLK